MIEVLPKFNLTLGVKLILIVRSIKRLNAHYKLGMTLLKRMSTTAVWGVGNCILSARRIDEKLTELELHPPGMMPPSDEAGRAWNEIGQVYDEIGWIAGFEPILIDDQSAYLDYFVDFLRKAESIGLDELSRDKDTSRREEASAFLRKHDQVVSLTTMQRAERWLESLGMVEEQPLTKLEKGVLEAVEGLVDEGVTVTDGDIAEWLAKEKGLSNKRGEAYSRSWIAEQRRRLAAKGYDLEA